MEGEKGEHKNEGRERGQSNKLCSRERQRMVTDGTERTYGGKRERREGG